VTIGLRTAVLRDGLPEREVNYSIWVACAVCHAQGCRHCDKGFKLEEQRIFIRIPPEEERGGKTTMVFTGHGSDGRFGGQPGNLYIELANLDEVGHQSQDDAGSTDSEDAAMPYPGLEDQYDLFTYMEVTDNELANGVTKYVHLHTPVLPCDLCAERGCDACNGTGESRQRWDFPVTLDAYDPNNRHGFIVCMSGQGLPAPDGLPDGDLYIQVTAPFFPREAGNDITSLLELPKNLYDNGCFQYLRYPAWFHCHYCHGRGCDAGNLAGCGGRGYALGCQNVIVWVPPKNERTSDEIILDGQGHDSWSEEEPGILRIRIELMGNA
jgi:DnaJ-class molecular chaperone